MKTHTQDLSEGRRAIWPGPQAQRMSKLQQIVVMRSSSSKRTYSVNFKLDCKPKILLQEILELEVSGTFPNMTIAVRILVSLPA
jgi:hypothetical protein